MDNEGYSRLCNAIIVQAVKEYMSAKKKNNASRLAELKRFFMSEWYSTLTELDGAKMIEMLDEKYMETIAKGKRFNWIDIRSL
jgi:hypothetical protein